MVTNGCPILDEIRPMAHFHLLLDDVEETVYCSLNVCARVVFSAEEGVEADLDCEGLKKICYDINWLNVDFAKRLHNESIGEATANASSASIVLLKRSTSPSLSRC